MNVDHLWQRPKLVLCPRDLEDMLHPKLVELLFDPIFIQKQSYLTHDDLYKNFKCA
jgi:hypothetical protein